LGAYIQIEILNSFFSQLDVYFNAMLGSGGLNTCFGEYQAS